MAKEYPSPKVFISYAWESEELKKWVLGFSTELRNNGIAVMLDQWEVVPGDRMPLFMEMAVRENNYVLVICSQKYKHKSENRLGGVGYEGDIMTAEVLQNADHRKFIPIIRLGDVKTAIPSWLAGKFHLDFANDTDYEQNFHELMLTLLGIRKTAPPLGEIPEKYRKELDDAAINKEKAEEENFKIPTEVEAANSINKHKSSDQRPRLEADLIWHGSSRSPRGYSNKNPTEIDENGQMVTIIGAGRKPIIHWELGWRFDLVIHNNSSYPAINIQIKSAGNTYFSSLEKLPKVNNIPPFENVALKAGFSQEVESDHEVADEVIKFKIPELLEGMVLEVSYQNEYRETFTTLVKVEDNKLVNVLN